MIGIEWHPLIRIMLQCADHILTRIHAIYDEYSVISRTFLSVAAGQLFPILNIPLVYAPRPIVLGA